MAKPTREDAQLLIQLLQLGASTDLDEAMASIFADDFDPEAADPEDKAVRRALGFWESVGTLTKNELVSVELVNDWFWVQGVWSRLGPAALKARAKHGEPRLFENFEALANG
jgi:hypothetical protein